MSPLAGPRILMWLLHSWKILVTMRPRMVNKDKAVLPHVTKACTGLEVCLYLTAVPDGGQRSASDRTALFLQKARRLPIEFETAFQNHSGCPGKYLYFICS